MIQDLFSPSLLRSVRSEIRQSLSFTPKETDIYRIHQSGDLANLDGLDDSSLKLLPSLLKLRDALYSPSFRDHLSSITGSGPLSGKKTDMAINVYTPGCHLLCHDDVIGSRRVSYILYLTDPDRPWQAEWGGALRLYPTVEHIGKEGQKIQVPSPDFSVSIPPAFNQLSFFAVQPGESFHDVEEVYPEESRTSEEGDEARVRTAISGWYHIPQKDEEGYVEGLEQSLAKKSSRTQLQVAGDQFDLPQDKIYKYGVVSDVSPSSKEKRSPRPESPKEESILSEADLDFLLKYLAPTYLTPDTLTSVSELFADQCSIYLETILSKDFAASLREFVIQEEAHALPSSTEGIEAASQWKVARPPHKQRFLFQQSGETASNRETVQSPIQDLLQNLIPSEAFRKWLQLATGFTIVSHNVLVRRFRRGLDYTLATGYSEDDSRLELVMALTPTSGWDEHESEPVIEASTKPEADQHKKSPTKDQATKENSMDKREGVGGYIAYMAGDDIDDDFGDDGNSDHGVQVPADLSTGARASGPSNPTGKRPKSDPAVYQAQTDDEDDGILISMPAGWNRLGLVLRDRGVMRFVKYVSRQAKGDRWDLFGEFGVIHDEDDDNDGEHKANDVEYNQEEDETEIGSSVDDSSDE